MNKVETALYRTHKTLREACDEVEQDFSSSIIENLDTCCSCGIWLKFSELIEDQDAMGICKPCWTYYGA